MLLQGRLELSRALEAASRALCYKLRERMPQADGLLRHGAKNNLPDSSEESCFSTPLDHIVHEAWIYLSSGAGLSSKCRSEEISK